MPAKGIETDSLLLLDVGSITTRALLFDLVGDRYRLLAAGSNRSTAGAPYSNVIEGIFSALENIQKVTGRTLIGKDQDLIQPSTALGMGVDTCAATISAGPPLRVCLVGLLDDVSLDSAKRLAATTYCKVVQTISLTDRQKPEQHIDTFLQAQPDVVIVAGGTEGGASLSVMKLLESVGLACYLMPEIQRPIVLFAGNQELKDEVEASLSALVELHFTENIRPSLDTQQFDAARVDLAKIYTTIRGRQINGVMELNSWVNGGLLPTASGLGRVLRFLSMASGSKKPVLGIDIGSSSATAGWAVNGELTLGVYPEFGIGENVKDIFIPTDFSELKNWLMHNLTDEQIEECLYIKSVHPASLPATETEIDFEHALARVIMRKAARSILENGASHPGLHQQDLLAWIEPLIASGSVLTKAPTLGHCALMLLDGIQPTGVTPIMLDTHHLVPGLGAAASVNSLLAIQVLDSNSLVHLGTVISPVGSARHGTTVLRVKVTYENGQETDFDIKYGSLEILPVPHGKSVRLHLQPLHNFDIGMGAPGRGGTLRQVGGGAIGIIIDARGRPFQPPIDLKRRQDLYRKWLWSFGVH